MIFDELNTAFRWYSSIDRQNRYKSHCSALCDFAILSTCNDIPPFQINPNAFGVATTWNIIKVDDDNPETIDISPCVEFINKYDVNGDVYLQYNGGSISGCMPSQLSCGKWYSTLEDDNGVVLYSELFEVVIIENADTVFPEIDPPIFSLLRFYSDINLQTRYKTNCANSCSFYLQSDKDSLPPFMFRANSIGNIQSFKLIGIDGDCETDIEISLLQEATYLGYDYIWYNGADISSLSCGKYYIEIQDETQTWYSELIELVDITSAYDYLLTDDGDILTTDDGDRITID